MNSSILIKRDRKDNDSNSSNDDDDKAQPGEFLVRATKFIGVIVGKGWGSDTTKVDNEVNERYQEATDNNLYRGRRSVRHTDSYHEDFGWRTKDHCRMILTLPCHKSGRLTLKKKIALTVMILSVVDTRTMKEEMQQRKMSVLIYFRWRSKHQFVTDGHQIRQANPILRYHRRLLAQSSRTKRHDSLLLLVVSAGTTLTQTTINLIIAKGRKYLHFQWQLKIAVVVVDEEYHGGLVRLYRSLCHS